MPDDFDPIGVSRVARASHLQRAFRRRRVAAQPDAGTARAAAAARLDSSAGLPGPPLGDVAIDFVDMRAIVARMHAAFFRSRR